MPNINAKVVSTLLSILLPYDVMAISERHDQDKYRIINNEVLTDSHNNSPDIVLKQEVIEQSLHKTENFSSSPSSGVGNGAVTKTSKIVFSETIEPKIEMAGFEVSGRNATLTSSPTFLIIGSALLGMIIVARRRSDHSEEQNLRNN